MNPGTRVKLMDANSIKASCSNCDLPSRYLKLLQIYTVESASRRKYHTRLTLRGFPGKQFNSSHFDEVERRM